MPYRNDLAADLEELAERSPASAAAPLLDLVLRLLSERHAYRFVLESVASDRYGDPDLLRARARDVCEEFVVQANDRK